MELTEEAKKALEALLRNARDEDRYVRDDFIRLWRRLDYYWNNILHIFLDPVSRDWRVPNWDEMEDEIPPRLINIFRPHGEAIVAALTVNVPTTSYAPDDAENPDDLETAQAYRHITDLLQAHNDADMLFISCVVKMFCQGTVFGYNYLHEDKKYGMITRPDITNTEITVTDNFCPQCGAGMEEASDGMSPEMQMGMPPEMQMQGTSVCTECGYQGAPEQVQSKEILPQIVGFTDHPKSSICQKIFDGRQVKVPAYVKSQEECGYLLLEFVQSVAMIRNIFQDDKISSRKDFSYESFSRLPPQYLGDVPDNSCNVSCIWLRPWQFWMLDGKSDVIEELTKLFPEGCYALFVNDEFKDAYPESMDKHWTISKDPLGGFIYMRPMSENLATVQDIRAELVEIEIQTAEHGIPETFADPKVLDFELYGEGRSQPGMVTKAKPRAGRSISDAFFQTKAATLSQEIDPLRQHIDQDAQFVVGSFPSIYGGATMTGSKTASEYSQSRAMALQRLGTIWKILCDFWANFQSKSATQYANHLVESGIDEKFAKKSGDTYSNVWIKSSMLTGRIGNVEPEATEQLPISWAQKKEAIMMLMQNAISIPQVVQTLMHPNNAGLIKRAIGLDELYVPGEEDRIRQAKEFYMMSQGVPVPTNPFDNDQIHIEVLKSILEGRQGEVLEQNIIQICEMHLQEHEMKMAQMAAQQQEQPPEGAKENVSAQQ